MEIRLEKMQVWRRKSDKAIVVLMDGFDGDTLLFGSEKPVVIYAEVNIEGDKVSMGQKWVRPIDSFIGGYDPVGSLVKQGERDEKGSNDTSDGGVRAGSEAGTLCCEERGIQGDHDGGSNQVCCQGSCERLCKSE